jgi:hypothetical protein
MKSNELINRASPVGNDERLVDLLAMRFTAA